jgi:replicative DNA helicase
MSKRRPLHEFGPGSVAHAEQALIGSLLIDPSVLHHVMPIVSVTDFCDPSLGTLFGALAVLIDAGLPVTDFTWLPRELAKMDVPQDAFKAAALRNCVELAVHSGHAAFYAEQVKRAVNLRRWAVMAALLAERASDAAAEPEKIAAWLEGQIAQMSQRQQAVARTIGEIATEVSAELDEPRRATAPPLWNGIVTLDEALGPIMPGELAIIAARTGCGKTSLATQWAEHAAKQGRPVLFVSLEMRDAELVKRMLCSRAGIDSRDLRSGKLSQEVRAGLVNAVLSVGSLPLRLWSPPSASLGEIRAVARHAKATGGLGLIVIDYIGLVRPDDRRLPRYEQVSAISADLKVMAKELEAPVIALAQLNREADGNEPKLSHLRESGSIEQDADSVLLIHHPHYEGPADPATARGVHVIIAKHRHGETGKVRLLWLPRETRFSCPGSF